MIAVHGQYGPAVSLSGQERDERLHLLLDRMGHTPLMNISLNDRQVLRQLGHMEQTQDGRRYVNGRAMSSEAAEAIILQLANLGHVVRRNLHVWTSEQKDLCTSVICFMFSLTLHFWS